MREPNINVFFYGLFMDEGVLRDLGVDPRTPRKAVVPGYRLRIGERATLLREFGAQSYGLVFAVTQSELGSLYGGAGLELYRPEAVLALFEDGSFASVTTYNLVVPLALGQANPAYAAKLRAVLTRLGFPEEYVRSVA